MHNDDKQIHLNHISTKINSIYICTCGRIPSLTLAYKDDTFYVLTKCNCEHTQQFKLSQFIKDYEHTLTKQQLLNNNDNTVVYFCISCNFHLNNNFLYENDNDLLSSPLNILTEHKQKYPSHIIINKVIDLENKCFYHKHLNSQYYCKHCNEFICELCYITMQCMHDNDNNNIIKLSNKNYDVLIGNIIQTVNKHEHDMKCLYIKHKESIDQMSQLNYNNYCDINNFIRVIINYYVLFKPFSIIGKINHNVDYAFQFINVEKESKSNVSFVERLLSIMEAFKTKMINLNIIHTEQKSISSLQSNTKSQNENKLKNEKLQITSLKMKVSFGYHKGKVTQIILLHNKHLCSCSEDNTIIIYTLNYEIERQIITNHVHGVNSIIQLDNGNIVSCSNDRSIKSFDVKTGQTTSNILKAHNDYITQLKNLSDSSFASASLDGIVNIWDNKLTKLRSIQHQTSIKFIYFSNSKRYLLCGLHNFNLFIWNINPDKQIAKYEYIHSYHPESIIEMNHESKIIIGGSNILNIINLNNLQIEKSITTTSNFNALICVGTNYLIAGTRSEGMFSSTDYLCVFDLTTFKKRIEIEEAHTDNINALVKLSNRTCATCSDDGLIIIWKY